MPQSTSDLANLIRCACLMEATARKPGNVHPEANFPDLCHEDFVMAADAVSPVLAKTIRHGVGHSIWEAVRATQEQAGTNANLGIVLLLAPLAAVPADRDLSAGIAHVLYSLTHRDAVLAYKAIRLANPGGLGTSNAEDVADEPTGTLLEVMRLAADRDVIALQYTSRFQLVLETGVAILTNEEDFATNWEQAVIRLHLTLMSVYPDTLIARKLGEGEARESAIRSRAVLDAGWPSTRDAQQKLVELDGWLRARGNARNPGATADLVAASLFAALRDGRVLPPEGFK